MLEPAGPAARQTWGFCEAGKSRCAGAPAPEAGSQMVRTLPALESTSTCWAIGRYPLGESGNLPCSPPPPEKSAYGERSDHQESSLHTQSPGYEAIPLDGPLALPSSS